MPVCLVYEPARRRIANAVVVNIGKTIENGLRVRFGHPSRNIVYISRLSRPAGRDKRTFTEGVTMGSSCRLSLQPLPVKKVAQKRPQAFLSNKSKILFPLQRRRPPPVAETGRSCWGSGQQDASAAQGTMRMLGAATRKARRAFQIVLFRKLPYRGRRRFRPAAPQCAAADCTLPHARCGWVHRS